MLSLFWKLAHFSAKVMVRIRNRKKENDEKQKIVTPEVVAGNRYLLKVHIYIYFMNNFMRNNSWFHCMFCNLLAT